MSEKFDLKDYRILYALDHNARAPLSEIATRAGLSKQAAHYRLKQLEKKKAIQGYTPIFDVAKLGFSNRKTFVKLQNAGQQEEERLVAYLKANPNVVWLASCDGPFDIAFSLRAPNLEKYSEQLAEINDEFGHLFLETQIAPIVRGQYYYRDYLIGREHGSERESYFGSDPQKADLDVADWHIMQQLGVNARTPLTDIARRTGLSADAVAKRVKKMETKGIIQNYTLLINNAVLGQKQVKILLKLRGDTRHTYNALDAFCRGHPNIFYLVRTFGSWNVEIDAEVKDDAAFRTLMREIKEKFSHAIQDYYHVTIYEIHKYNFCPSLPAELMPKEKRK